MYSRFNILLMTVNNHHTVLNFIDYILSSYNNKLQIITVYILLYVYLGEVSIFRYMYPLLLYQRRC